MARVLQYGGLTLNCPHARAHLQPGIADFKANIYKLAQI